ncbi:unnamed protein product, partial [Brassica oleracea]
LNAYLLDQAANEFYNSLQTPTVRLVITVNTKHVAVMVNASEVTKAETLTIRDIFAFLKQEPDQPTLIMLCARYSSWLMYPKYENGVLAEIFQPIMGKGLIPV